jgi:hypothetical protein
MIMPPGAVFGQLGGFEDEAPAEDVWRVQEPPQEHGHGDEQAPPLDAPGLQAVHVRKWDE